MSTITLRGVDPQLAQSLKERAKQENSSVNALLLTIIKESLGLEKKQRRKRYNDLDHLAGTWSERDAAEFEQAISSFETVDENLWQ
ncbi:hypothetical protein [Desulfurivibrio sp. C05AmB]|jgi:hypothetical protein|uniref:hypothetical protein n=1 Tax=Desulfurivibrio sp. C05AmB TaxID=3374371 RepID=UPI00376F37D5